MPCAVELPALDVAGLDSPNDLLPRAATDILRTEESGERREHDFGGQVAIPNALELRDRGLHVVAHLEVRGSRERLVRALDRGALSVDSDEGLADVLQAVGPHRLEKEPSRLEASSAGVSTPLRESSKARARAAAAAQHIKGWYAKAFFTLDSRPGDGEIRVNKLLDSPDVSADTLRYLLWHEYLHLFLKVGHTEEFRTKERSWPGWMDRDRELDGLNERFGIQYW